MDSILAVTDIGSNTVMTKVMTRVGDVLEEFGERTSLGEGMAVSHLLQPEPCRRTLAAIERQWRRLKDMGRPLIWRGVATAAVRQALNGEAFLQCCQRELDLPRSPVVLSERQEAEATFQGAASVFPPETVLLNVDSGGGSTEVSLGTMDCLTSGVSLPAGCVSWRDAFGLADSFNPETLQAAMEAAKKLYLPYYKEVMTSVEQKGVAVSVSLTGGTGNGLRSILLQQKGLKPQDVLSISMDDAMACLERLAPMTVAERRQVPGMRTDRADILPAGLSIVLAIFQLLHVTTFVSNGHGLRDGILQQMLREQGA